MVPEKLLDAAEELFQIDDDIRTPSFDKLPFEMLDANNAMTDDGLSMGQALGEATQAWLEDRVAPPGPSSPISPSSSWCIHRT